MLNHPAAKSTLVAGALAGTNPALLHWPRNDALPWPRPDRFRVEAGGRWPALPASAGSAQLETKSCALRGRNTTVWRVRDLNPREQRRSRA
jgi:hypothetical protein